MPDSGEMDYVLTFEALPEETQVIHLLSPSDTEGNTYDISLVPQTDKTVSPLVAIKGNWFKTDDLNAWEYGIYDSVTIMNNRIFTNETVRKKGKRIEITVKDKQNGETCTLLVTPQKDGNCKIQANGEKEQLYTRQRERPRPSLPIQVFSSSSTQTLPVCKGISTATTDAWDLIPD